MKGVYNDVILIFIIDNSQIFDSTYFILIKVLLCELFFLRSDYSYIDINTKEYFIMFLLHKLVIYYFLVFIYINIINIKEM